MKLAHFAVVTPHKAGLYETARDLVAAERLLGINACIVDPTRDETSADRGVPICRWEWVTSCDAIVSHSGVGDRFKDVSKPIVHVMHGRPHSSFLLEQAGKIPVLSFLRQIAHDGNYRAFVTFWPEFLPYWQLFVPRERLYAIPAPVDLNLWTPEGPNGYQFHGYAGSINVVCAEVWRDDIDPFHIIVAFARFAEGYPGHDVRLHVYAAPEKGTGWGALATELKTRGILGEVCGFVRGLENAYRAAHVAITAQRIATRSVREPMACGCPVVTANDANPEDTKAYAKAIAEAIQADRRQVRLEAVKRFNPQNTARAMVEVVKRVV